MEPPRILANHGDQSLLRNYYAFNLAYKAGIGYKSTLIEVYLNGKYNGVYLLTSKVEESRLNVDEKDGGFLIELDEYASGKENVNYFVVGRERYTLKSDYIDSKQMKSIKSCITEIEEAIKNAINRISSLELALEEFKQLAYTKEEAEQIVRERHNKNIKSLISMKQHQLENIGNEITQLKKELKQ